MLFVYRVSTFDSTRFELIGMTQRRKDDGIINANVRLKFYWSLMIMSRVNTLGESYQMHALQAVSQSIDLLSLENIRVWI